jgi:hypothetical protein
LKDIIVKFAGAFWLVSAVGSANCFCGPSSVKQQGLVPMNAAALGSYTYDKANRVSIDGV